MDTETLAGFAMPARASTFNSIDCTNSLGGSGEPPDAENRRFSELIKRIHTNERRSPGGFRPKRPYRPFGSLFLIIECLLGSNKIIIHSCMINVYIIFRTTSLKISPTLPSYSPAPGTCRLFGSVQSACRVEEV